MKIKSKLSAPWILLVLLSSCGGQQKNNPLSNVAVSPQKVYFLTTNYQESILYSIDMKSLSLTKENTPILGGDVVGFQSSDATRGIYLVERFSLSKQDSRVTSFSPGQVPRQSTFMPRGSVPVNVYDMMFLQNDLYFLGYDDNSVSLTNSQLSSSLFSSRSLQGNTGDHYFTAMLKNETSLFVLASNQRNEGRLASVEAYALDGSLYPKEFESSTNLEAVNSQGLRISCYDIVSLTKVSSSRVVITCNPHYQPDDVSTLAIFSVDVSGASPNIQLLREVKPFQDGQNHVVIVGGLSQDKSKVLVTEESYHSDYRDYQHPSVRAYWLDINQPTLSVIPSQGAYDVAYHEDTNSYLFSCYLVGSACADKTFGLAQGVGKQELPNSLSPFSLNHVKNDMGVRGVSFFKMMN
jgi:hypothetical protein